MGVVKAVVKHSLLRTLSVISTLLVIGGSAWLVYVGMIRPHTKPNPTTRQEAETIQNITYDYTEKETMFLGLKIWKLRFGVSIK